MARLSEQVPVKIAPSLSHRENQKEKNDEKTKDISSNKATTAIPQHDPSASFSQDQEKPMEKVGKEAVSGEIAPPKVTDEKTEEFSEKGASTLDKEQENPFDFNPWEDSSWGPAEDTDQEKGQSLDKSSSEKDKPSKNPFDFNPWGNEKEIDDPFDRER